MLKLFLTKMMWTYAAPVLVTAVAAFATWPLPMAVASLVAAGVAFLIYRRRRV